LHGTIAGEDWSKIKNLFDLDELSRLIHIVRVVRMGARYATSDDELEDLDYGADHVCIYLSDKIEEIKKIIDDGQLSDGPSNTKRLLAQLRIIVDLLVCFSALVEGKVVVIYATAVDGLFRTITSQMKSLELILDQNADEIPIEGKRG